MLISYKININIHNIEGAESKIYFSMILHIFTRQTIQYAIFRKSGVPKEINMSPQRIRLLMRRGI
ncbi:hypothetical protein BWD42_22520 [Sphingobacterium sp. CZ-UAM]|nr:hypothetical protein BWD42_22520 [Sphingobacterium sp. CZ-UAM]